MIRLLSISILMLISTSVVAVELPPCDKTNIQVDDPEGFLTRLQDTWTTDLLKKFQEVVVGNNYNMGVALEMTGTGGCVVNAWGEGIPFPSAPMQVNCFIAGITGIGWKIADTAKDIATGTINAVGNVFDIDLQSLGKSGNEFADKHAALIKAKQQRHIGELFLDGGLHLLDWFSTLIRSTSLGVGKVIKGFAVRLEALWRIPKDVIQQSLNIAQNIWIGNGEAIQSSAKRIGWRLVNSPKAVVLGCEPSIPGDGSEKSEGIEK